MLREMSTNGAMGSLVQQMRELPRLREGQSLLFGARYVSRKLVILTVADPRFGQNITKLQVTPDRVFALSASGHIYVLSASAANQELPVGTPTPSSTPWWGTGWMWGEEEAVDFVEVTPHEKLARKERSVSRLCALHLSN